MRYNGLVQVTMSYSLMFWNGPSYINQISIIRLEPNSEHLTNFDNRKEKKRKFLILWKRSQQKTDDSFKQYIK